MNGSHQRLSAFVVLHHIAAPAHQLGWLELHFPHSTSGSQAAAPQHICAVPDVTVAQQLHELTSGLRTENFRLYEAPGSEKLQCLPILLGVFSVCKEIQAAVLLC